MDIFLRVNSKNDVNLYYNEDFIQKLVYTVDIFEKKKKTYNKSMQGLQTSTQIDKCKAFVKK